MDGPVGVLIRGQIGCVFGRQHGTVRVVFREDRETGLLGERTRSRVRPQAVPADVRQSTRQTVLDRGGHSRIRQTAVSITQVCADTDFASVSHHAIGHATTHDRVSTNHAKAKPVLQEVIGREPVSHAARDLFMIKKVGSGQQPLVDRHDFEPIRERGPRVQAIGVLPPKMKARMPARDRVHPDLREHPLPARWMESQIGPLGYQRLQAGIGPFGGRVAHDIFALGCPDISNGRVFDGIDVHLARRRALAHCSDTQMNLGCRLKQVSDFVMVLCLDPDHRHSGACSQAGRPISGTSTNRRPLTGRRKAIAV